MIKNKCKKIVLAMLIMTMIATTVSVDVFAGGDNSDCISDICESCAKGCMKGCLKGCIDSGCCPCITYPTTDDYDFNEETKELTLLSTYSKTGPIPQYTNEIKTVTIKQGVKRLVGTFQNCYNLTSVYISDTVEEIGENAFANCKKLKSIEIPDSVTKIGARAFQDCIHLESVEIPESVTKIGAYVFKGCAGLTEVIIPGSVKEISKHAFDGCKGNVIKPTKPGIIPVSQPEPLKSDVFIDTIIPPAPQPEENKGAIDCITTPVYPSVPYSTYIPSGVTSIADREFKDRKDLTSITIPDSVTEIGKEAFKGCTSLKNVEIGENVISIGKEAFKGCISLESITIPKSVKSVGEKAFADCTSLNSVSHFGTCDLFSNESIFANHCNGGFKITKTERK